MSTKIYIIGGLGSGKSYFAKKLSKKIGVDHFEIDRIVFKEHCFEERTPDERDTIFRNITEKDSWILEGTFTEDWITPGLESASQIIYLRIHPLVRLYRFIQRISKQGILTQHNLFGRVKLVLGLKHGELDRTSSKYQKLMQPFKNKIVILKSSQEVERYLNTA